MTAMNDVSELWSLPWHALQRSLAKRFGAEMTGDGRFQPCAPPTGAGAAQSGSWMERARGAALRPVQRRD